jgi:hypothetical protein
MADWPLRTLRQLRWKFVFGGWQVFRKKRINLSATGTKKAPEGALSQRFQAG